MKILTSWAERPKWIWRIEHILFLFKEAWIFWRISLIWNILLAGSFAWLIAYNQYWYYKNAVDEIVNWKKEPNISYKCLNEQFNWYWKYICSPYREEKERVVIRLDYSNNTQWYGFSSNYKVNYKNIPLESEIEDFSKKIKNAIWDTPYWNIRITYTWFSTPEWWWDENLSNRGTQSYNRNLQLARDRANNLASSLESKWIPENKEVIWEVWVLSDKDIKKLKEMISKYFPNNNFKSLSDFIKQYPKIIENKKISEEDLTELEKLIFRWVKVEITLDKISQIPAILEDISVKYKKLLPHYLFITWMWFILFVFSQRLWLKNAISSLASYSRKDSKNIRRYLAWLSDEEFNDFKNELLQFNTWDKIEIWNEIFEKLSNWRWESLRNYYTFTDYTLANKIEEMLILWDITKEKIKIKKITP